MFGLQPWSLQSFRARGGSFEECTLHFVYQKSQACCPIGSNRGARRWKLPGRCVGTPSVGTTPWNALLLIPTGPLWSGTLVLWQNNLTWFGICLPVFCYLLWLVLSLTCDLFILCIFFLESAGGCWVPTKGFIRRNARSVASRCGQQGAGSASSWSARCRQSSCPANTDRAGRGQGQEEPMAPRGPGQPSQRVRA